MPTTPLVQLFKEQLVGDDHGVASSIDTCVIARPGPFV